MDELMGDVEMPEAPLEDTGQQEHQPTDQQGQEEQPAEAADASENAEQPLKTNTGGCKLSEIGETRGWTTPIV